MRAYYKERRQGGKPEESPELDPADSADNDLEAPGIAEDERDAA